MKKRPVAFALSVGLLVTACSDLVAPTPFDPIAPPSSTALFFTASALSSDFTVLANAAVTCTDGSIAGDVGTFQESPIGSFTDTDCQLDGEVDIGGDFAKQEYEDFLAAYAALADVVCDENLTSSTLTAVTLQPGVYCFDEGATVTGTLTLQGSSSDTWLFQIGTTGTGALTGTNFFVVMDGGGDPCSVAWWTAQAATMTDSDLKGNVLAGTGITLTRGTLHGNAWAGASGDGDVSITGTTVTGCESTDPGDGDPGDGDPGDGDPGDGDPGDGDPGDGDPGDGDPGDGDPGDGDPGDGDPGDGDPGDGDPGDGDPGDGDPGDGDPGDGDPGDGDPGDGDPGDEDPVIGNEGCTPGYWKNHHGAWLPTDFSPLQIVGSVFTGAISVNSAATLGEALDFRGGGGIQGAQRILLRAAVASLLNAGHPDVDFDLTVEEVIAMVDAALASGNRKEILDLAEELDALNNAGCLLQGGPGSRD